MEVVSGKNEGEQQGYSAMMWIPIQEKRREIGERVCFVLISNVW